MKTIERILCEAEDAGLQTIESEYHGIRYIFSKGEQKVAILTARPRAKVILPMKALREIAEIAEVWCG